MEKRLLNITKTLDQFQFFFFKALMTDASKALEVSSLWKVSHGSFAPNLLYLESNMRQVINEAL